MGNGAGETSSLTLNTATSYLPGMSGGLGSASVYQTDPGQPTKDTPSTFVFPSDHPDICLENPLNDIQEGDLLFVLDPRVLGPPLYEGSLSRGNFGSTPVVTLSCLNALLQSCVPTAVEAAEFARIHGTHVVVTDEPWLSETDAARNDALATANEIADAHPGLSKVQRDAYATRIATDIAHTQVLGEYSPKVPWYACPDTVKDWARPFGVALNRMGMSQQGGGYTSSRDGVNVVVALEAVIKNSFMSATRGAAERGGWYASSGDRLSVQYSLEMCRPSSTSDTQYPVVCVSTILVDEPVVVMATNCNEGYYSFHNGHDYANVPAWDRPDPMVVEYKGQRCYEITNDGVTGFESAPLRRGRHARVVVPIGRVLHSATRSPTAHEATACLFNKAIYNRLAPLSVVLGAQ